MSGYVNSGYGKLRRVLLCKPDFYRLMPSNNTSKVYLEKGEMLNLERAKHQYDEFCDVLKGCGVELVYLPPEADLPYQLFTRDLGTVTPLGAILGKFRWDFRREEIGLAREVIARYLPIWENIPEIENVFFEGGDFIYMDSKTAALGVAGRTSASGARFVQQWMDEIGYEVIPVHFDPDYCHLDMVFNVVAEKICVACTQLLPEDLLRRIRRDGWQILETNQEQVLQLLGNLFAVDNGKVVSPAHNKSINSQLRSLGVTVLEVEMEEILRGGGGPHCMTFPLQRDCI